MTPRYTFVNTDVFITLYNVTVNKTGGLLVNNQWKLFNLKLLGIELCTNFVYQINNNHCMTGHRHSDGEIILGLICVILGGFIAA